MTQNDLLAAARRGEADAIASLLNRQLRTKGMTVRVTTQGAQGADICICFHSFSLTFLSPL